MASRGRPAKTEPKLSKEEQVAKLQAEIITDHIAEQSKRITDIVCGNCEANLELNAEDFIKEGTVRRSIECPNCEKINDVTVGFPGNPNIEDAIIRVVPGGFVFEQRNIRPTDLTDKQIDAWMESETKKVKDGSTNLPRYIQIMLRHMEKR